MLEIKEKVRHGKNFFESNSTLNYRYRLESLKKLQKTLKNYQKEALNALKLDLNKSYYESFVTEFALTMSELSFAIKNLKKWMKPERKIPGLSQMPAKTRIYQQAYGLVLIISPWNYPLQLSLIPLISAVSAGNTVILKVSNYSKNTSCILEKIIIESFEKGHVSIVKEGREKTSALLNEKFDYIFFTGSPKVGKLVMQKASQNLTPVTLELGGKSPCIVASDCDIKTSAKRICFGKLLNAGQICVAPDYVLVNKNIADEFINELIRQEQKMLKNKEYTRKFFPKIINQKHLARIYELLEDQKKNIIYQSNLCDKVEQIPFTIIKNPGQDSKIMQEEIFAPILPIISYTDIDDAFKYIKSKPQPLALYLFTKDKKLKQKVITEIRYGGGCINDSVLHIASHKLPFGGIGNSGIGNYHGKYGFDTFSSKKSVLEKYSFLDLNIRYHPYKKNRTKLPLFLFKH